VNETSSDGRPFRESSVISRWQRFTIFPHHNRRKSLVQSIERLGLRISFAVGRALAYNPGCKPLR
jgi:hypothetical protein